MKVSRATIAKVGLGVLIGASWPHDARAATITVTSNGAALSNDGTCTLPEAVKAVNLRQRSGTASGECAAGDGASDTIRLMSTTQTYALTSSLVINRDVRIDGFGRSTSIIRSTAARIFDVQPLSGVAGPSVKLSALAIENGRTDSNAVYGVYFNGRVETPKLELTDVVVRNCTNGVRALGLGQTDNEVLGWKLAIEGSKAEGFYCEGCSANLEQAKITGSQGSGVRTRSLEADGWPTSLVVLTDSVVDNNGSTSTLGGGVRLDGGGGAMVNLVTSTVSNNRGSSGGGVYTQGGLLAVYTSTISSNTATRGGGVYIDQGPVNGATPGENNFYDTTIANNTASTRGGGLFVAGRQAMLSATILGDNTDNGSGTKSPDCYGDVSMWSDSGNMIENGTGCSQGGSPPPWQQQGDLGLGPLIDVGTGIGLKAHFPLKNSPIVNTVWREGLEGKDQRQMSRPEPHYSDAGALFFGLMWEPGAIEYNTTWHPQHLNVAARSADAYTAGDSDGYFRFVADAVGDFVTFAIPVSEAGVYDVRAHVGKMRDGGNYQLEVSNSLAGPYVSILTQDFYTAASTPAKTAMTGSVTIPASGVFQPGLRYFRFRVLGHAATSIGYRLRLAYFDVAKR